MSTAALIVTCDEDSAVLLVDLLAERGAAAQSSPRRNLDGVAITSWLVVAGVAVKSAPDILRALADFLTRNTVRRIEYQGIVLDKPRPEDVDRILDQLAAKAEDPPR